MQRIRLAIIVATLLTVTGCVSNTQPGLYGDSFNQKEAAKTRMSLGLTYLKNNNYTQAKKNLDKALEFDPSSADVHYSLAYYYQLVGDTTRAEESYETAIDLAPGNGDIANSYGAFKCQNGNYQAAKVYFLKAINNRQYANSAQTYENLALCAQSQGNAQEAIDYLKEALNHQPARQKSLLILTEMYMSTEQWEEAKATLRKYEKVANVSPDSLWMAFEIARGQGDRETAKQYGDMLVSVYPESNAAKRYAQAELNEPEVTRTVKADQANNGANTNADSTQNSQQPSPQPKTSNENSKVSTNTPQFHIVKQGENLYRISLMHNIKVATLQNWNNLEDPGAIFAGMKLWLVPVNMQEE
ncbi:type IV pilus biogenesis/stability protein PilW [Alteromonas sp. 345S023]|uniref:Type IV pilus biogenesis/stability protein PilW n=1 Tax=Alteromonas profundi TaxID=2696062 RepID=A0A7X5RM70_9ALTE|nr:type IV pilus biogenesis/stability protein PilW [Alteromonas profundi]NDV92763.1 type IV pilus biogenesis/stability protein PilW [Alteromonas profundi]